MFIRISVLQSLLQYTKRTQAFISFLFYCYKHKFRNVNIQVNPLLWTYNSFNNELQKLLENSLTFNICWTENNFKTVTLKQEVTFIFINIQENEKEDFHLRTLRNNKLLLLDQIFVVFWKEGKNMQQINIRVHYLKKVSSLNRLVRTLFFI